MTTRKGRKISGGRYIARRKKKLYERPGQKVPARLGEEKRKTKRVRSAIKKTSLLSAKFVNIKQKDGKIKKLEIKNVLETPSNKFLARQNIITKGTIVQTSEGKAKITSKPGQHGILNAVLIE